MRIVTFKCLIIFLQTNCLYDFVISIAVRFFSEDACFFAFLGIGDLCASIVLNLLFHNPIQFCFCLSHQVKPSFLHKFLACATFIPKSKFWKSSTLTLYSTPDIYAKLSQNDRIVSFCFIWNNQNLVWLIHFHRHLWRNDISSTFFMFSSLLPPQGRPLLKSPQTISLHHLNCFDQILFVFVYNFWLIIRNFITLLI